MGRRWQERMRLETRGAPKRESGAGSAFSQYGPVKEFSQAGVRIRPFPADQVERGPVPQKPFHLPFVLLGMQGAGHIGQNPAGREQSGRTIEEFPLQSGQLAAVPACALPFDAVNLFKFKEKK